MKPRSRILHSATATTPGAGLAGGARVIDRYEIVAVIGRGATGAVYRAVDTRLGRTVALKAATGSRDSARLTDRVRQRFLREAMALSRVDQRNVVQVLDYGFADDGTPFLVMEHLRGRDLGARLALDPGPLPVAEVADIGLGVCAALRACHRVGIIHRDLKAANVFLVDTDTGIEIKVLDFGVSTATAADDHTRPAAVVPAWHHLAPEQIDGKVGPASDQYALGVLLHLCLTRRYPDPLRAARATTARADLPPPLDAILRRATRVTPADRFESVYALGRELLEFGSPRAQAQWRAYYRPDGGTRPAWAALAPTERVRPVSPGTVTSTKVSRWGAGERGGGRPRPRGVWPLGAATVGCVALAATGLAVTRRRPPKPAPPVSARREIAPPARHPPVERATPLRGRDRPPAPPPVTVTAAALGPQTALELPEREPPVTRRRPKTAAPAAAVLPNIDGAGIGIPPD